MRLPKRGFNRHKIPAQVVNLRDLNRFENGTSVTPELLLESGLVGSASRPIKILGDGELEVKGLRIEVVSCSRSAIKMIEAAGGSVSTAAKSDPEESS
jgi:large subunit ribosomal protein L15